MGKTYEQKIAEAVRDATIDAANFPKPKKSEIDLDAIIASVERPEPVGKFTIKTDGTTCNNIVYHLTGLPTGEYILFATPVAYKEVVSAEPVVSEETVNARLLDAAMDIIDNYCDLNNSQCCVSSSLIMALKNAAIDTTEQAKPAPELTDEVIYKIAHHCGVQIVFNRQFTADSYNQVAASSPALGRFARAIIKADRELRGEWE